MKADYYSASICRAMERLGCIELRATGTSMFPFIREGDTCFFRSFDSQQVRTGDVLLFLNEAGSLVCHRVLDMKKKEGEHPELVICKGDTNRYPDQPVPVERMIGRLTHIHKGRFTLSPDKGFGRLWGKLIIGVPLFSFLLHRIAIIYRWHASYLSSRS